MKTVKNTMRGERVRACAMLWGHLNVTTDTEGRMMSFLISVFVLLSSTALLPQLLSTLAS